jgi:putative transposase
MKGKRFTEEQIIRMLQEAEAGLSVADVCRKHNCSEQSFYRWKAKFGGMEVSAARRLRELERENAELQRIVADQTLGLRMLKDVNSRKW